MISLKECVNDILRIFYNKKFELTWNDPGLKHSACSVKDYYKGYPHIIRWEKNTNWYDSGLDSAYTWCKENCKGKFTTHIHRVTKTSLFGEENEWRFDDLNGVDYCFWAFSNESDAIMFSLVW